MGRPPEGAASHCRHRRVHSPCPHVPAHAVDVGLDRRRHIEVDDGGHVLEVDAPRDTVLRVLALAWGHTHTRCWSGSGTPKDTGTPRARGHLGRRHSRGRRDTGKGDPRGYEDMLGTDTHVGIGTPWARWPQSHGDRARRPPQRRGHAGHRDLPWADRHMGMRHLPGTGTSPWAQGPPLGTGPWWGQGHPRQKHPHSSE